jgi:hypothetical protein
MNFRLAYKPRACLPTVNQLGQRNGVEKRGERSNLKKKNYGDNFSQCGRWSRFQRAKTASLVSANRNGSVGDST